KDSEKLIKFKQALKKGKEGVPDNLEAWLESFGVDFKKLSLNFIQSHFLKNSQYMIGNEENIEVIGEYIGLFLRNRRSFYHVPIIGITGSGKSLFLSAIQHFIVQSGENIKFFSFESSKFDIDDDEKLLYKNDEVKSEKLDVVFIDSCEKDKNIFDSLTMLFGKLGNAVYITTWTPESFNYWSQSIEYSFPFSKKIILTPFDNYDFRLKFRYDIGLFEDFSDFIWNIEEVISLKNGKNKEEFRHILGDKGYDIRRIIFKYSKGVPSTSIKLFIASIRETFLKRREKIEGKTINDAAKRIGISSIVEKLDELSPPQLRLLETILLLSSEESINPTKLAKRLKLDTSTVSYNLNILREQQILDSKQTGRKVSYNIKENLIPFVQMKILVDFDYLKLKDKEKMR
ncbi:MAG: hypothetical protein ACFFG0_14480, partial [Candidatus Thorarchaeota archaeon]